MKMSEPEAFTDADVQEAFPVVDPGATPLGARVMIQLRKPKSKATAAGIILPQDVRDTEKAQNMIGKVICIGPLAFRNRDTMEKWPEGSWAEVGDYVRVPKWTADRWEVAYGADEIVEFMILNDHEIIAKVTCNPLLMKAFV